MNRLDKKFGTLKKKYFPQIFKPRAPPKPSGVSDSPCPCVVIVVVVNITHQQEMDSSASSNSSQKPSQTAHTDTHTHRLACSRDFLLMCFLLTRAASMLINALA